MNHVIIDNYINGKLVPPVSGLYLDNIEPATGKVYGQIPDSDSRDVQNAFEAAREAFPKWSSLKLEDRSAWLMKLAQAIEDQADMLAMAETQDNGKPIQLSTHIDIPRAVSNFRFFAHALTQYSSQSHHMSLEAINYTLRQPLGVVGCIAPWNLPLYLLTWKIAPALAAGNTVVAKPTEVTPYTAYLLSRICTEIGFPEGVLNFVHGTGPKAGEPIIAHPGIKAISFTGGTATGKRIAEIAAPMFKKLSLELGGKNPTIIFDDCDYDNMLSTTIRSSFANQGQICLCGSRIYVQNTIYEKFKKDFTEKVSRLEVGDPMDIQTKTGAVVSLPHMEKILSYINLAREEGGQILAGGHQVKLGDRCQNGYFIAPTVIEGLDASCRTNQEEIFGPVVTIAPFESEEEVLQYANGTHYGLAATLWTENLSRAHRMAETLEFGIVWINCWLLRDLRTPFGGVKNSGVGREGGFEALNFFTEPKNVCIKYG
jgi:aminomuconate-semialdehyde/2-hydroxymuconate-6-semialdehyde dehydrogenase